MSEPERWDAPNQQAVGLPPPWTEDNEGNPAEVAEPNARTGEETSLDEMKKDELLEYAREIGASPANHDMTKDELRASIDAKQGEG